MPHANAQRRAPATEHKFGSGHLHDALVAADDAARLYRAATETGCEPAELSADGGKTLDIERVLEAMHRRGYAVSAPIRPQSQTQPGFTAWTVEITVQGVRATLAFFIPNSQATRPATIHTKRSTT